MRPSARYEAVEEGEEGDSGATDGNETKADAEEQRKEPEERPSTAILEETRTKATKNSRKFGVLLRSKGFVWIATRPWGIGEWSQAGVMGRLSCDTPWFATVPDAEWPEDEAVREAIRKDFIPADRKTSTDDLCPVTSIGDRRQELVFIGTDLETELLSTALDACLLTPEELERQHSWWREETQRQEAAEATIIDSGDAEADAAAREAAVERLDPTPNPLAAEDPFDEWKLDFLDDEEVAMETNEGDEEEEEEDDDEIGGGLD